MGNGEYPRQRIGPLPVKLHRKNGVRTAQSTEGSAFALDLRKVIWRQNSGHFGTEEQANLIRNVTQVLPLQVIRRCSSQSRSAATFLPW